MKFIQHPADLPPELLEAYQEQKLIFFCGAGVSNYGEEIDSHYHSFDKLCRTVLKKFDLSWDSKYRKLHLAKKLYKEQRYDELLEYMADQYGFEQVDHFIQQLFVTPPDRLNYSQHQTILKLASGVGGRIVTTNFDTLFTKAQKQLQLPKSGCFENLYAPTLPIARVKRWEAPSIVYLHGGVEDTNPKKQLIYSSSGFGQAYITDGWAARFITELVQHFHLCFVGYSINDPIMNYMMQAIKANENKNKNKNEKTYSYRRFVCHVSDTPIATQEARDLFRIKGVDPIAFSTYPAMWEILDEWHTLPQQDIITLCQQEFQVFEPNAKTLTPEQRYVIQNLITKEEKHFPETQSAYRKVETTSKLAQAVTAKQLPIGLLYAVGRIDTLQRMDKSERKRKSQETKTDFALFDALPNLIQPDFKPDCPNPSFSQYGHLFRESSQTLHPVACTWVMLICQNIHKPEMLIWILEQNRGAYLAPYLVNQLSVALQFSQHEAMPEELKKGWELLLLNQRLLPRDGFNCLSDDQLQNNTLATRTYFTQKLRPYLRLIPPYYHQVFSEQNDEKNQVPVYYEAEIEFQQKDLTFHELEKCSEQATDPEMLVALMGIIENTVHQYLQLFAEIEKDESFIRLFEIPSILRHGQNQGYRQLPQLFAVIEILLAKLVEQEEIDWCNQAMERYAQQPHTLWHRMVLAYTTKYELNLEPAWTLLRANQYAYIEAFNRIKKEFYELLEYKADRLPDDIRQTCFKLLRQPSRDYQQHIEVEWDNNEKYNVLRLLKAQDIALPDEALETVYQTLLEERQQYQQTEDATDQFKFSPYSTGFTWVQPDATPEQLNEKPDDALLTYFKGEGATHRYPRDLEETFRAFVEKYPVRAFFKVFLPLLSEDATQYSKLYLQMFDWGLAAYIDPTPRPKQSEPEESPSPLVALPILWTLVESFFMLDTVHDTYQALYSSTAFIRKQYRVLWQEDTPRFWRFFEMVWQRAVQKLAISEQSRPDFLSDAINAPIGRLVETLLGLELQRLNKNPRCRLLPETITYLESIPTLENGTMLYSLLGRNLALLLKMHLVWTETQLIPLLTATTEPDKTKGLALSEGLIGYGQWTYLVHNHLKKSLLQLDMGVHFNEQRDYQLFNNYVSRILESYFVPQNEAPDVEKITLIELHAWLASLPTPKSLDCVARELVVYYKQVSVDEAETLIEQFLAPLLTKGWVNTVDKRTPQQTSYFLQLALVHPKYFGKIISIVKEANLILRLPDEATFHDLCFYWLEKEQLEALALEDFELFCNVILDYLPLQPINTSTYLLQEYLYKRLLAQQTYPLPKALEAYFTRMLRN